MSLNINPQKTELIRYAEKKLDALNGPVSVNGDTKSNTDKNINNYKKSKEKENKSLIRKNIFKDIVNVTHLYKYYTYLFTIAVQKLDIYLVPEYFLVPENYKKLIKTIKNSTLKIVSPLKTHILYCQNCGCRSSKVRNVTVIFDDVAYFSHCDNDDCKLNTKISIGVYAGKRQLLKISNIIPNSISYKYKIKRASDDTNEMWTLKFLYLTGNGKLLFVLRNERDIYKFISNEELLLLNINMSSVFNNRTLDEINLWFREFEFYPIHVMKLFMSQFKVIFGQY